MSYLQSLPVPGCVKERFLELDFIFNFKLFDLVFKVFKVSDLEPCLILSYASLWLNAPSFPPVNTGLSRALSHPCPEHRCLDPILL